MCVGTPIMTDANATASTTRTHTRPSWDDYFLGQLPALAARATCDRGRSAAIFVKDNDQIAAGYVGSPPGMPHCDDVGHLLDETGTHCLRTIHAEQNAMIRALRHGISLRDTTVYCTMVPCFTCAKLLVGTGVYRVVALHHYHDSVRTQSLFADSGVKLVTMTDTQLYEPCSEIPYDEHILNYDDTSAVNSNSADNDKNTQNDLMCPVHNVMFSAIEKSIDGRRICPHGDVWRVIHGVLICVSNLKE